MTAADIVVLQDEVPKVKLDAAIVDYILDLWTARATTSSCTWASPRAARLALTQAVPGVGAARRPRLRDAGRRERAVHARVLAPRGEQDVSAQRRCQRDRRAC
jgi:hypothetical protein